MTPAGPSTAVALAIVMLAVVSPAHALSRLNDGDVAVAMVDGRPCFAVERYLGPISLVYTRKFRPRAGQFAAHRIDVDSARPPFAPAWSIEAPAGSPGWRLDPGQCIALGDAPPGSSTAVGPKGLPLPEGIYRVTLWAEDLRREARPRLGAVFCVLADGRLRQAGRRDGRDVCEGRMIDAGRYAAAPATPMTRP